MVRTIFLLGTALAAAAPAAAQTSSAAISGLGIRNIGSAQMSGRIAALAATYAVEHLGTQVHSYTTAEFAERFNRTFPDVPPLDAGLRPMNGGQ